MISAVVFDLGGVVCRFDPERRLQALSTATGLTPERIDEAIWESGLDEQLEAGRLSPDEARQAVLDALESRLDPVMLRVAWSMAFVPNLPVCRLLERVRTDRFLFTNNGPIVTECLADELQTVSRLFSRTLCSWEIRVRKPDVRAFTRLAHELERLPNEMVLVDDAEANCVAADSMGMQTICFSDEGSLERRLDGLGLLGL